MEDEMGRVCSTHGKDDNYTQHFSHKTYTEEPTKNTKPTQDNIKSDLKYGVNCIHLIQGKDRS
jgi:hypothetical protein